MPLERIEIETGSASALFGGFSASVAGMALRGEGVPAVAADYLG